MKVKRRNAERFHSFANEVASTCGIYDLQGLLMNGSWEPTAAIEAFEVSELPEDGRFCIPDDVISDDELYFKCAFAEQVGVPLYLLISIQGQRGVSIYEFAANHIQKSPYCVSAEEKSEEGFVAWWRERKQTVQTKAYREDLSRRIADSYFDRVLESRGEKWGGNIDGFLVDRFSDYPGIMGIVENRFTSKIPLSSYDPNRYFNCGGWDYYTWLPLFNLHQQMDIPLFLATYSNRQGETRSAGLTVVESLGPNGITYVSDRFGHQITPCRNIMSSALSIGRWFHENT